MSSRLIVIPLIIVAVITVISRPATGQENVKPAAVELISHPEVEAVLEVLRKRNTEVRQREVRRKIVEYQRRTYRSGLFGRRICVQIVPVERTVIGTVSDVIEHIEKGIGWGDSSDPRLGYVNKAFSVAMLPQVAGGRGTRVNVVTLKYVPPEVDSDASGLDRTGVVTSTAFSRNPAVVPAGKERIYRILAQIGGPKYDSVTLTVMVQERDAATGVFLNNKAALNTIADGIWTSIQADLIR